MRRGGVGRMGGTRGRALDDAAAVHQGQPRLAGLAPAVGAAAVARAPVRQGLALLRRRGGCRRPGRREAWVRVSAASPKCGP